jgi:Arc/MetJ-type ribon-helix-helix transcriptional regulator
VKTNHIEYPERLSVQITTAMDDRLEQVARGRDEPKAEVVRAALRAYLDEQEDIIGSRKHFTKAFGRRIDQVERLLMVLLSLDLDIKHMLVERLTKQEIAIDTLLDKAIESGVNAHEMISELVEMFAAQKTKPPA